MEKKFKRFIIFGVVFASVFTAGLLLGINGGRGRSDLERSGIDPARVEHIEDKLGDARKSIERAEVELSNARSEVTESLAVVGELGSGFDTIEKGIGDCQSRIESIEGRNNRIKQIILEAKKRENNLDERGD
ncbi:MAG: hypothetical protein P1P64_03420 [Treponemataceae bacterium]